MSGFAYIGEKGQHLGDGMYASFDGWQIWLQTMEGDKIALEPQVFVALVAYERGLEVPEGPAEQPA